jgi:CubicO group peptidase (beta-lactamase class C family)
VDQCKIKGRLDSSQEVTQLEGRYEAGNCISILKKHHVFSSYQTASPSIISRLPSSAPARLSLTMLSQTALFSLSPLVFAAFANAFAVCPLVGPNWPALSSVGSSTIVQAALKDLSDELDTGFETGNTTNGPIDGKSTSISIALFDAGGGSGGGKPYFYEYHHAAPSLGAPVSFDSIYRIGDLSQVLIVYAFLVQAGDDYWHERVTKYVPELKKLAGGGGGSTASAIEMVDWSEVTLGELASHMAGIGRDGTVPIWLLVRAFY